MMFKVYFCLAQKGSTRVKTSKARWLVSFSFPFGLLKESRVDICEASNSGRPGQRATPTSQSGRCTGPFHSSRRSGQEGKRGSQREAKTKNGQLIGPQDFEGQHYAVSSEGMLLTVHRLRGEHWKRGKKLAELVVAMPGQPLTY